MPSPAGWTTCRMLRRAFVLPRPSGGGCSADSSARRDVRGAVAGAAMPSGELRLLPLDVEHLVGDLVEGLVRVVEECDHALLVLVGSGGQAIDVAAVRDLPDLCSTTGPGMERRVQFLTALAP